MLISHRLKSYLTERKVSLQIIPSNLQHYMLGRDLFFPSNAALVMMTDKAQNDRVKVKWIMSTVHLRRNKSKNHWIDDIGDGFTICD